MTLEDFIDAVADGKKPYPHIKEHQCFGIRSLRKGENPSAKVVGRCQLASGVLEFYYKGQYAGSRLCANKVDRRRYIGNFIRNSQRLEGEKYFLWKPDIV